MIATHKLGNDCNPHFETGLTDAHVSTYENYQFNRFFFWNIFLKNVHEQVDLI